MGIAGRKGGKEGEGCGMKGQSAVEDERIS